MTLSHNLQEMVADRTGASSLRSKVVSNVRVFLDLSPAVCLLRVDTVTSRGLLFANSWCLLPMLIQSFPPGEPFLLFSQCSSQLLLREIIYDHSHSFQAGSAFWGVPAEILRGQCWMVAVGVDSFCLWYFSPQLRSHDDTWVGCICWRTWQEMVKSC